MVRKELQKYVDQEAQLQGALSAIQEYAGTNSKEEINARVAIGDVSMRYHPHPGLEFYAAQDSGFAMAVGRALTGDTQTGIIDTAKSNLEATVGLLSEKDLVGMATDVIIPSGKKDAKHDSHRLYLEVRDDLITEQGVNISEYLEPFNQENSKSKHLDALMNRIASQEAETKDGRKVRVATQIGEELVKDFVDGYKREFLGKFGYKDRNKIDFKDLSKYATENLKDLPEGKPEEAQLKDNIIYTIVKTAVKPTEPEEKKKKGKKK